MPTITDNDPIEQAASMIAWQDIVPQAGPTMKIALPPQEPAQVQQAASGWGSLPWEPWVRDTIMPTGASLRDLGGSQTPDSVPNWWWDSNFHVPYNAKNVDLFKSMGFGGNATTTTAGEFGDETRVSPELRQWMLDQGISEAMAHLPGSKPGGRPEFWGYVGKDGKWIEGQADPHMTISDTLMDNITPFLMLAGPFAQAISTASSMAGAAGAGASSLSTTLPTVSDYGLTTLSNAGSQAAQNFFAELAGTAVPSAGAAATNVLPAVTVAGSAAPSLASVLGAAVPAATAVASGATAPKIDTAGLNQVLERVTTTGNATPQPSGTGGAAASLGTSLAPVVNAVTSPTASAPTASGSTTAQPSSNPEPTQQLDRVTVEGTSTPPTGGLESLLNMAGPIGEMATPTPKPTATLDRVTIEGKSQPSAVDEPSVPPLDLPDVPWANPLPVDWYNKVLDQTPTELGENPQLNGNDLSVGLKDILKGLGSALTSGGASSLTGGLVKDLAGVAAGNYLYQGAQRDSASAKSDYDAAVKHNKDALTRLDSTADFASGAFKDAIGKMYDGVFTGTFNPGTYTPLTADADWRNNNMVKAFMDAAGGGAAARLGSDYSNARAKADAALGDYNAAQAGVAAAIDGLGARKKYGEEDVNRLSDKFYNLRSGALDRALAMASSQGYAAAATRGLADSTQAGDTRDEVVRRFADKYGELQASSITDAMRQTQGFQGLEDAYRSGVINEAMTKFDPKTRAQLLQVLTGSADSLAATWANADSAQASRNLQALLAAEQQNKNVYDNQYNIAKTNWDGAIETSRQRNQLTSAAIPTLGSVLNSSLVNSTNAGMKLVEESGKNYRTNKAAEGAAMQALLNALGGSKTVGSMTDAAGRIIDKAGNVIGQKVGGAIVDGAGNLIDDLGGWLKGFFGD